MTKLTPMKAIRAKCIDCCCGDKAEVRKCVAISCVLHPYRMGKNPYIKRTMTDEQKEAAGKRLKEAREKRNDTNT